MRRVTDVGLIEFVGRFLPFDYVFGLTQGKLFCCAALGMTPGAEWAGCWCSIVNGQ